MLNHSFLSDHGDHLEADILLNAEAELPEGCDDPSDFLHHAAHILAELVHRDGSTHHGCQTGLKGYEVCGNLLMKFRRLTIGTDGSHPLVSMDGLVGGGGEHEEFVPLVREELCMDVHRDVLIEREPPCPLDQLVHNAVANLAELAREICRTVVQQFVHILKFPQRGDIFKVITVYEFLYETKTLVILFFVLSGAVSLPVLGEVLAASQHRLKDIGAVREGVWMGRGRG